MQLSADRRERTVDRLRVRSRRPERPRRAARRDRMDRVLGVAILRDTRRRVPSISTSASPIFLQLSCERYRARRVSRPATTRLVDFPRREDLRGEGRLVPSPAESQEIGSRQVRIVVSYKSHDRRFSKLNNVFNEDHEITERK